MYCLRWMHHVMQCCSSVFYWLLNTLIHDFGRNCQCVSTCIYDYDDLSLDIFNNITGRYEISELNEFIFMC